MMTEQERYMKEALKQAKKAIPLPMRKSRRSIKPVKRWEIGGWKDVRFT